MPPDPAGPPALDAALSIEAKLRGAFELSPTILAITTAGEGRLLEVNHAFTEMHGYARDEVIGRTVGELGLWVDPEAILRVRDTGKGIDPDLHLARAIIPHAFAGTDVGAVVDLLRGAPGASLGGRHADSCGA